MPYLIQRARLIYLFSQYTTSIQVSLGGYSFMTGIPSYNSQLTLVYLLHTENRGKTVLPSVFNMVFPTSPLMNQSATTVFQNSPRHTRSIKQGDESEMPNLFGSWPLKDICSKVRKCKVLHPILAMTMEFISYSDSWSGIRKKSKGIQDKQIYQLSNKY